jgi:Tfp pilus assembly protein PilV
MQYNNQLVSTLKLMRTKKLNNTGVTLLEILLASIIFVISVAGIFATLSAVRTPVGNKENALAAAVFGKQVLETLRTQVNAGAATYYGICTTTCATNCTAVLSLCLGAHALNLPASGLSWPTTDLQNANAALNYTVTCADGSAAVACGADVARKVVLNIHW